MSTHPVGTTLEMTGQVTMLKRSFFSKKSLKNQSGSVLTLTMKFLSFPFYL